MSSKSVAQQGQLFENMTFCVLESDFVQNLSGNGNNNSSGGSTVRKFTREDVSNVDFLDLFVWLQT